MRRSILIVMLDVMVLSVLALTSRQRAGGGTVANIPVPGSGISRMVEEGLRNEAGLQSEIARLEAQLKEAAAVAQQALAQAARERSESADLNAKLRESERDAERARSEAALAAREAELVNRQAALAQERMAELEQREAAAKARTHEIELRELEARARAEAAQERARLAEETALKAERLAQQAGEAAGVKDAEALALKQQVVQARLAREQAEKQARELNETLAGREAELIAARSAQAEAEAIAQVAAAERERLAVRGDAINEKLMEARESVAAIQEQKKGAAEKIAQLEEEKKRAEAELNKSVWVRRDEALRRVEISYTEYNSANDRSFRTHKQLAMPLVKMGEFVFIPAEFKALGLKRSFLGGLSERVTDVVGVLGPMVSEAPPGPLNAIIVPATEPQVCLLHSLGETPGALESITMQGVKEQRLRSALLFSPHDENDYGQVEISPVLGRDYLNVQSVSGKKPKVGDYLLTERGQFIGVMVESELCYVLPDKVASAPKPVIIPLTFGQKDLYYSDFVSKLNLARELLDAHLGARRF